MLGGGASRVSPKAVYANIDMEKRWHMAFTYGTSVGGVLLSKLTLMTGQLQVTVYSAKV